MASTPDRYSSWAKAPPENRAFRVEINRLICVAVDRVFRVRKGDIAYRVDEKIVKPGLQVGRGYGGVLTELAGDVPGKQFVVGINVTGGRSPIRRGVPSQGRGGWLAGLVRKNSGAARRPGLIVPIRLRNHASLAD